MSATNRWPVQRQEIAPAPGIHPGQHQYLTRHRVLGDGWRGLIVPARREAGGNACVDFVITAVCQTRWLAVTNRVQQRCDEVRLMMSQLLPGAFATPAQR